MEQVQVKNVLQKLNNLLEYIADENIQGEMDPGLLSRLAGEKEELEKNLNALKIKKVVSSYR